MIGTYHRFSPPRPVKQYTGQTGHEPSKLALPWWVMDSLGRTIPGHLPDEYAVIGETIYEDGRRYLDFGVTREFIEAATTMRWDTGQKKFRELCPRCGVMGGKHAKGCDG